MRQTPLWVLFRWTFLVCRLLKSHPYFFHCKAMAVAKNNFLFKQKATLKRKLGEWLLRSFLIAVKLFRKRSKKKPLTFCKEPKRSQRKCSSNQRCSGKNLFVLRQILYTLFSALLRDFYLPELFYELWELSCLLFCCCYAHVRWVLLWKLMNLQVPQLSTSQILSKFHKHLV